MRFAGLVMRIFSYLFHLALGMAMMALAFIAWLSGYPLQIYVLNPWQGNTLNNVLFFGGLAGILLTVLAFKRKAPVLFVAWSVIVFVMLVRGFLFSSYSFGSGSLAFSTALWFIAGALLALLGSFFTMRKNDAGLKRKSALA